MAAGLSREQRDLDLLRNHLLGDLHAGPGLLRRVRQRVEELTHDPGPVFRTGSIIHTDSFGQSDWDSPDDSPKVLELVAALVAWKRHGDPNPTLGQAEVAGKLRDWKMSDGDLLLGAGGATPMLDLIRKDVQDLLRADLPDLPRLHSLADYLRGWLDEGCAHDFEAMRSDDARIVVMECPCGAKYLEGRQADEWLPV